MLLSNHKMKNLMQKCRKGNPWKNNQKMLCKVCRPTTQMNKYIQGEQYSFVNNGQFIIQAELFFFNIFVQYTKWDIGLYFLHVVYILQILTNLINGLRNESFWLNIIISIKVMLRVMKKRVLRNNMSTFSSLVFNIS